MQEQDSILLRYCRRFLEILEIAVPLILLICGIVSICQNREVVRDRMHALPAAGQFARLLLLLNTEYVGAGDFSVSAMATDGLAGMTQHLDPYSRYYSVKETQDYTMESEGNFCGVGIEHRLNEDGSLLIQRVYPGYPAEQAGLTRGCRIISVDGVPLTPEIVGTKAMQIRGKEGTGLTLEVLFPGEEASRTVSLVRALVETPCVYGPHWLKLNEKASVAYVKLEEFDSRSSRKMREALERIAGKGEECRGMIWDLRGNPGGDVQMALEIASYFLPEGRRFVSLNRKRHNAQGAEYESLDKLQIPDTGFHFPEKIPLVILVDGGSASASEMISACLNDYKRAVLLGEKTFGKGIGQSVLPLEDGSSLHYTAFVYVTPDWGRPRIQGHGVIPDIPVTLTPEQKKAQNSLEYQEKSDGLMLEGKWEPGWDPFMDAALEYLRNLNP